MHTKNEIVKKGIFMFFLTLFIISACNKEDSRIEEEQVKLQQYIEENGYASLEPTESGLYHVIIAEGEGESPSLTDYVNIHFTAFLIDGTIFETSDFDLAVSDGIYRDDKMYGPTKFLMGGLGIMGLREGILLMNEGGLSKFIIPSKLAFGSIDYGTIPPYSTIIYDVELLDVISDPEEHEQALLDQYIADNEISVDPTHSGLYYIEREPGTGDVPEATAEVSIFYTGKFLDGREFDKSGDTPFPFSVNSANIIAGMKEGVKKMKEGGTATLIIPWNIAYGATGTSIIPPYATLIFDVELVEIK